MCKSDFYLFNKNINNLNLIMATRSVIDKCGVEVNVLNARSSINDSFFTKQSRDKFNNFNKQTLP